MTKCGNDGLLYGCSAAYSTLLALGKTGLGASGIYCIESHLSVTECNNGNRLSGDLGAASGTVNYVIVRSIVYAIRSYVILNGDLTSGVTKC